MMPDEKDPVVGMCKLMAKLFAFMAAEVTEQCGAERGEEIIRSAVHKFGVHRGTVRKAATLAAGKELTLENFEEYSDLPHNNAWDADTVIEGGKLCEYTRYCPFADTWRELGMEKLGSLYCGVDEALCEGYFGEDFSFARPGGIFSDRADAPCTMEIIVP